MACGGKSVGSGTLSFRKLAAPAIIECLRILVAWTEDVESNSYASKSWVMSVAVEARHDEPTPPVTTRESEAVTRNSDVPHVAFAPPMDCNRLTSLLLVAWTNIPAFCRGNAARLQRLGAYIKNVLDLHEYKNLPIYTFLNSNAGAPGSELSIICLLKLASSFFRASPTR